MDVLVSLLFLVLFPLHFILVKNTPMFFQNIFDVLAGRKTWIGYASSSILLPKLRKGVLGPNGLLPDEKELPEESLQKIDRWYAMDYEPLNDLALIIKNYRFLGIS